MNLVSAAYLDRDDFFRKWESMLKEQHYAEEQDHFV